MLTSMKSLSARRIGRLSPTSLKRLIKRRVYEAGTRYCERVVREYKGVRVGKSARK